jgi:hypothetical protein
MRAALRLAVSVPIMRAAILRACAFFFFASALWALLPLVVRQGLGLGPAAFGLLLGASGGGAGLIADANGDLFGTTLFGGPNATDGGSAPGGTVFEIAKTASGYATTPTILYSFCAQTNCTDGANPFAGLIADAHGDLFGTSEVGGAHGEGGTVFEVTFFAGTPGQANCIGKSVLALTQQYHGLANAAAVLGYSSLLVLQNAIASYCAG